MRRNMDLIRDLLLKFEEMERPLGFMSFRVTDSEFVIDGFTPQEINAHIGMLFDARFIESGTDVRGSLGGDWYFHTITWEGRDFLDSVRQPQTWQKTKSAVSSAGGFSVSLLAEVAKAIIKGELQKLGVPLT